MFLLSGIETSLLYMTTPTNDTPHGCRMIGPYRFYNCFSSQENTLIHLIKTMLNRGRSRNNVFSQFFFLSKGLSLFRSDLCLCSLSFSVSFLIFLHLFFAVPFYFFLFLRTRTACRTKVYYHTRITSLVCSLPLRIHVYFLYK